MESVSLSAWENNGDSQGKLTFDLESNNTTIKQAAGVAARLNDRMGKHLENGANENFQQKDRVAFTLNGYIM